ncbi:MAG: rhodanese-like domain-containing protein [Acidobacteria bacterium]|nr:rhodanese-like domain-containing protein [Acidobacteriota bacterium]
MSECTVLGLKDQLGEPKTTLIDVREFPEYSAGRVPGARLIPLGEIEKRHIEIDHNQTVYVICRSGKRGGEAQKRLKALGFPNVINVVGGTEAWKAAGLSVEKDQNAVWDLERQVRFTAGIIVLTGVLLAVFVNWYFIVISGFVGAGLVFAAVTNTCAMGMLLARMPWNKDTSSCPVNTVGASIES